MVQKVLWCLFSQTNPPREACACSLESILQLPGVESEILPHNIAKLILNIIRHDSRGLRLKKRHQWGRLSILKALSAVPVSSSFGEMRSADGHPGSRPGGGASNPLAPTDSFNEVELLAVIS